MSATQLFLRLAPSTIARRIFRGLALTFVAMLGGTLLSSAVGAQSLPASCAGAPSGKESVLSGRWVVLMQGWQGIGPGAPMASAFSFDASGTGSFVDVSGGSGITGNIDANFGASGANSVFSGNVLTAGSSYSVGLDPTNGTGYVGCMTLANSNETTLVLRFALSVNSATPIQAVQGRIILWTDASGSGAGNRASGLLLPQDATAFSGGTLANVHSNYAFGEDGADPTGAHFAEAGTVAINTSTGAFTGTFDTNDSGTIAANQLLGGTIAAPSSTTGRALATNTSQGIAHTALYIVNANELFVVGIDPFTTDNVMYSGRAIVTGTSFSNASLTGNYITLGTGSSTGNASCNSGGNCAKTGIGILNFSGTGLLNNSSTLYNYQMGAAPQIINPSGAYSVAASGRVTLPAGNPVLYLATPQSNTEPVTAFLVGTDLSASFGELEAGASSNVSVSAMTGNYIHGSIDPGDSTLRDQTGTARIDSGGNITGYQYQSATSNGLTDGSINNGGGGSNTLTISNSPLPGIASFGGGSIVVTNGSRLWFVDTGTNNGNSAAITIVQPTAPPLSTSLPSATALASSLNPSVVGQSVTFTAPVNGSAGTPTGTVSFFDGSTLLGSNPISNGQATFTTSSLTVGSHSITAQYSGDTNFSPSTSNVVTQVVQAVTTAPGSSSTSLVSSVDPSIAGQLVTFTATVAGSGATPTGTVTFMDGNTSINTFTLSGGSLVATFSTSSLVVGTHSITAQYSGDTNFSPSTSNVVTQQVGSLLTPLLFGPQAVDTTSAAQVVTVAFTPGAATTITSVVVTGDFSQTNTCGASVPSGQTCQLSIKFSPTTTGPRTGKLTLTSSDPSSPFVLFLTGNSALQNLPGFMTTPFARNDDGSTGLVSLGFTANFFGTNYTGLYVNNNGNVTFDSPLSEFTPFALTTTSRVIMAPFFADVDTDGAGSNIVTYGNDTVNGRRAFAVNWVNVGYFGSQFDKLNTFQIVLIDRSDVGAGDFDAEFNYDKIQWETGEASGGVDGLGGSSARAGYSNGTGNPGTFFELPGSATNGALLDSNTTAGLIYLNSTSAVPGRTVFQVRNGTIASTINVSATALASSLNPSVLGQSVTFTAPVNGSAGTPTGTVSFLDGTTPLGSGPITNGQATFTTSLLTVGTHSIKAVYAGDVNFSGSTSNVVSQVVSPSSVTNPTTTPTFILLSASPDPSTVVGQSVAITAVVAGSGGTPTGIVNFLDNGVSLGTATLNGSGAATFTTTSLAAGSHPLTAQYFGDPNFAGSFSALITETVGTTTPQPSVQITPIPTNVVSGVAAGGTSTVQFTPTVLNAGTNPTVTWQLTGPGSISSTGLYTAPSTAPTSEVVTLVATATSSTNQMTTATVQFTIAADALTSTTTPQTVAPGATVTATVNLTGAPATGPTSTVQFTLACSNLPVGATCVFTNCATPPVVITFVTGASPCFKVMIKTASGTTTTRLVPQRIDPQGPSGPAGPWYAIFAVLLTALAMLGSRSRWMAGRMRYVCLTLVLLSVSVAFITSCNPSAPESVTVPVASSVTPPGSFQALVVATPQNANGSTFVQTQLIVPFTVQ